MNIIHQLFAYLNFVLNLQNPRQVTIIAVGPLTNIALCYSMYGQDFSFNIKELYIMGGNHQGK